MLKIIHLTDLHLLGDEAKIIFGINPYLEFRKIANTICKIKDVDCILITGDIANAGEYEAYIHVNDLLEEFTKPIYWLPGNHDFHEVMSQVATRIKIRADNSFIVKGFKFILLHTVMRDEDDLAKNKGRGYLFNYELSYLKRELHEDNFEYCIIGLHHPPIKSNTWTDDRMLVNYNEFREIIEQYHKVKLVIYGHQHITQHTVINGINYISSPPTSYHYDPNGEKFSLLVKGPGYGIISIDDDGDLKFDEFLL
jgi:Icc protein